MLKKRPSSREANTQMLNGWYILPYEIWGSFGGGLCRSIYTQVCENTYCYYLLSCIFADICNIFVYIIISMYIQCTVCTKYIYLNLHMTHSRKRVACLCQLTTSLFSVLLSEANSSTSPFSISFHAMNILQAMLFQQN